MQNANLISNLSTDCSGLLLVLRCVLFVHHMIHLFLRFIDDDCEQLKALAKSGEFWSGPMTRKRSVAWVSVETRLANSSAMGE